MRTTMIIIAFAVATGLLGQIPSSTKRADTALEQERLNDERMWQVMRLMLVEFGYSNKVAALDLAWQKTKTPQQWAQVDWSRLQPPPLPAEAQQVAARCAEMNGEDFPAVFQTACRIANDVRTLLTGLLAWTQNGGKPSLQGRHDLALHFIYAAVCELSNLGQVTSFLKEQLDQAKGKPFDLDDLAAGFAGAEWVRQSRKNPRWLQLWASGEKNIQFDLPNFSFGVGSCSPELLCRIQQDVEKTFSRVRQTSQP